VDFLLHSGPFEARDAEGRSLYSDAMITLPDATAVAISGPSGGGKTTLLRQLTGVDLAGSARRTLEGRAYSQSSLPEWRARVTLIAQDGPVLPGTIQDNLEFPYRLKSAGGRAFNAEQAHRLLESLDLGQIPLDRDITTLSGGERHRLAVARGLLWDPPVLVADEPLSGVDTEVAGQSFELLLDFARRPGHALLVVLHHQQLRERVDRILRLEGGELENPWTRP
jgi:ABC-type lipoprotein export system ATPase subunit